MNAPNPQDHFEAARSFQEYYDTAMREVGVRIPSPTLGQTCNEYRRKTDHAMVQSILPPGHPLSSVDFRALDSQALDVLEPQLLQACKTERMNPANVPPGQIVPRKVFDSYTGRLKETRFIGQECFVKQLGRPGRRVVSINDVNTGRVWDAFKFRYR